MANWWDAYPDAPKPSVAAIEADAVEHRADTPDVLTDMLSSNLPQARTETVNGNWWDAYPDAPAALPESSSYGDILLKSVENTPDYWKQAAGGITEYLGKEFDPSVKKTNWLGGERTTDTLSTLAGLYSMTSSDDAVKPEDLTSVGRQYRTEADTALKANAPIIAEDSYGKRAVSDITSSVAQNLPGMLLSAAIKSPAPALAALGAQSFGAQYDKYAGAGMEHSDAARAAAGGAAAETAPELLPLHVLLKPGTSFLKRAISSMGAEAFSEAITQSIQSGIDKGTITPDMTLGDALEDVGWASFVGAGAGGVMSIPFHLAQPSGGKPEEEILEIPAAEKQLIGLPAPQASSVMAVNPAGEAAPLSASEAMLLDLERQQRMDMGMSPFAQVTAIDTAGVNPNVPTRSYPDVSIPQAPAKAAQPALTEPLRLAADLLNGTKMPVEQAVAEKLVKMTKAGPAILPAGRRALKNAGALATAADEIRMAELEREYDAPTTLPARKTEILAEMDKLAKGVSVNERQEKGEGRQGLLNKKGAADGAAPKEVIAGTITPPNVSKTKKPVKPQDLVTFLAKNGGVRDETGDLKAIGAQRFVPGAGSLVRPMGKSLDEALQASVEAGYGEFNTTADLLNAIDQNTRGQKVYSVQDADVVEQQRQEASYDPDFDEYQRERAAIENEEEILETAPAPPRRNPLLDGMKNELSDALGIAAQEEDIPFDVTPTGKQAVIPGAEKISDRNLAERKMEGKKKATKPQQAADDGLFDLGARKQVDLLDAPPKAPKPAKASKETYPDLNMPEISSSDIKTLYKARKKIERAFSDDVSAKQKMSDEEFDTLESYGRDLEAEIEKREAKGEKAFGKKNDRDYSVRRAPSTPEFKKWFGKSKVVDETGAPKIMYHATTAPVDFDTFQTDSEMGAHFGTTEQSNQVADGGKRERSRNIPVYLNIQNPVRLRDTGGFDTREVLQQLVDDGVISSKESAGIPSSNQGSRDLQNLLKSKGHDGIVYLNRREGFSLTDRGTIIRREIDGENISDEEFKKLHPDAQDSYVAFSPEQIKSAIGNKGTFDPDDGRIDYASRKETPKFTKSKEQFKKSVLEFAKRINPNVNVGFADTLMGEGRKLRESGAGTEDKQEVGGYYDSAENLIKVSLNLAAFNPEEVAFHELFHSLEGVLSPQERAELQKKYPGRGDVTAKEHRAYAFADFASKRLEMEHSPAMRRIWTKIIDFLKQVGSWLRGNGFRSVDDVFEKAYSGEIGARIQAAQSLMAEMEKMYSLGRIDEDQKGLFAWMKENVAEPNIDGVKENIRMMKQHVGNMNKAPIQEQIMWSLRSGLQSIDGALGVLQKAGNNSPTIGLIRRQLFSPVAEQGTVGRTYFEEIENSVNTTANKLGRILTPFTKEGRALKNADYLEIARLVRNPKQIGVKKGGVHKAAQELTDLLKNWREYLVKSGFKIADTEGYFPRIYDRMRILSEETKFLASARKAYLASGSTPDEAANSAMAWLDRLKTGDDVYDPEAEDFLKLSGQPPMPDSLKSRTLSKEADEIMEDFLINDPLVAISQHIVTTARKAAYAKRFGVKQRIEIAKKLEAEGNLNMMRDVMGFVERATGMNMHAPFYGQGLGNMLMTGSTLAFMDKSALSSLTELFAAGMSTGNVKAAWQNFSTAVKEFIRPGNAEDLADISELVLGTTGDMAAEMLLDSRMDYAMSASWSQKIMHRYYRAILLHRLTEAQRKGAIIAHRSWIKGLASDIVRQRAWQRSSKLYLKEMGIPEARAEEWSKWLLGVNQGLPNPSQMQSGEEFMQMYNTALQRKTNKTILNVTRAERNAAALHPYGRLIFHLQGFINAFSKNILLRNIDLSAQALGFKLTGTYLGVPQFKRHKTDLTVEDRLRIGLLPMAMTLALPVLMSAALNELRDVLFHDPERDPKTIPATGDAKWWGNLLSRAGLTGSFDPWINALAAVKYDTDFTTSMSGAYLGGLAKALENFSEYYIRNSENTGTAERNAAKSAYNMILNPLFDATVLSFAPNTPIGRAVSFGLIEAASNPRTRTMILDSLGVPRKGKIVGPRAEINVPLDRIFANSPPVTGTLLAKYQSVLDGGDGYGRNVS